MTTAATLMKEIETLPEEYMTEALNFILFLKNKSNIEPPKRGRISIKEARGIFSDMRGKIDSTIEREEEDRV
jgi:hypothetical protein